MPERVYLSNLFVSERQPSFQYLLRSTLRLTFVFSFAPEGAARLVCSSCHHYSREGIYLIYFWDQNFKNSRLADNPRRICTADHGTKAHCLNSLATRLQYSFVLMLLKFLYKVHE